MNYNEVGLKYTVQGVQLSRCAATPRRVDSHGFEVEGMYAARTTSRSGRFIKPFKTAASKHWNVSGEPWLGEGFEGIVGSGGGGMGGMGSRTNSFSIAHEHLSEEEREEDETSTAGAKGAKGARAKSRAGAGAGAGTAERPKTSSSKMPPRYNRGGPSPTKDRSYIGDEGEVIDSWPHQQDDLGGG